jgi:hypothetical protein
MANLNWLNYRRAGALFDLARTPYVVGTDGLTSNPKKAQGNLVANHTRKLLPDWPASTVFKIKGTGGANVIMNKLELETTSTVKTYTYNDLGTATLAWSDFIISPTSTIYADNVWSGGDNKVYGEITMYINAYTPVGGTDYWEIITYSRDILGNESSSITYNNGAPNTSGNACLFNGVGMGPGSGSFFDDPGNSIYAVFSGGVYTGQDMVDDYGTNPNVNTPTAYFCARSAADSAHGLSSYVILSSDGENGSFIYTYSTGSDPLLDNIFSYRHAATDNGAGTSQQNDTECKWYYTPNACEDCWYDGKVVTVDITYKKAQVTKSIVTDDDGSEWYADVTHTLGSWSTHSTVTQTLTLPSGFSRTQVGSTFSVPTQAGYVVAIDDIKLVSVA